MIKLKEHTCGTHIYMKMQLDNMRIEEIDVFIRNDGMHYVTSADHCAELYADGERDKLRNDIISAFNALY